MMLRQTKKNLLQICGRIVTIGSLPDYLPLCMYWPRSICCPFRLRPKRSMFRLRGELFLAAIFKLFPGLILSG